jgi:hypothetical protein
MLPPLSAPEATLLMMSESPNKRISPAVMVMAPPADLVAEVAIVLDQNGVSQNDALPF